ncbi:uncharacterized protein ACNS7B_016887 [Menidia menidia]
MMETLATDSTDHETSAQESGWDETSEHPGDANSDSGESLFITQAPVPEAVRSERRRRSTFTSTQTDDDTSDSSSDENSKTDKKKIRKKGKMPMFSFPFLAERANEQSITELPRRQNNRLHKSLMRGYFECVRTMWNGYERGDLLTSLPTIDMNEVHIPPISEVEEEEPEDEEFKVVEKKRFVVTLKGKCSKSGFILKDGDREVKRQKKTPSSSGSDSRERRWTRDFQNLSSDTDYSDEEDSSQSDSQEEETGDEHVTTSGKFTVLKEASVGERTQQESEPVGNQTGTELVYDAVSELRPDEPEQTSGKVFTAVTDDQRDVSQRKNEPKRQNHDMLYSKNGLEKKRKGRDHETLEGEKDDGQKIADGQHPAAYVCEGTVEVDEVLSQAISEPDYTGLRTEKNKKSAAEEAGQKPIEEPEEREEVCGTENVTKKKKKKRKRSVDSCVQVELFQENSATEHQADVGDAPKKKKKKKKKDCSETSDLPQMPTEHLEETADCLENPEASQETLESTHVKRKKHKKKKKSDSNEHTQVGEDAFNDVELANDDVTLAESAEPYYKKKKKRKVSEPEHIPIPPEDDGNVDGTETMAEDAEIRVKKKKKKRKKSSTDMSEDTVAPGDFSASAQKQLEKSASSFLVADEEENAGQTLRKKCTDSCPEKPSLSVFSAEMAGSLEETNGGVRKKKRKKRSATQQSLSGEADYEEPEERGQTAPCDSGVKTKDDETVILKKRKKKKNAHGAPAAASEDAEPDHPSSRTPEIQTLGDKRGKTKKKKGKGLDQVAGVESFTGNAETEVFETENKERKEPTADSSLGSHPETSSSGDIKKNKLKKAKRKLHNLNEDLFSEC